jgi:hypothetical protein
MVQEIRADPVEGLNKYPEFPKEYPRLYQMCTNPTFDMNMFQRMLDTKQKIQNAEVSEHDGSVEVGTLLVDKYVKPLMS